MILLIAFAFLAGIITILSPCILPVLPIILSSTADSSGKWRPLGVVVGFVMSFTFFTLFLSTIVAASGISADALRFISVFVIGLFGLSLLVPQAQIVMERLMSRMSSLAPNTRVHSGFLGGVVIGLSLGLLWTPCVGPILASVISLAITGTVTLDAAAITLAYALGTSIPMFIIMAAGGRALQRVPWLVRNTARIQKAFGVVMILTAMAIVFNLDRQFQTWVLRTFPSYGVGLTKIEDNELVREQLGVQNGPSLPIPRGASMADIELPRGPFAPDLTAGGEWFNVSGVPNLSQDAPLASLRGRVVIVDFWTYSCINCQRTIPYLNKWYEKYKDQGLVIIGVHSPEFEFEKNPDNVAQALEDFGIKYPVVQDNDFATWRSYDNRYWPAKYIVDHTGAIRYSHFGEGAYDETERVIQKLLQEAGAENVSSDVSNPAAGQNYARTHEKYLGYGRIEGFASPEQIANNVDSTYSHPTTLGEDEVSYEGAWNVMSEYAHPQAGSTLDINFEAREVYLVMRSKSGSSRVRVTVDGKVQAAGASVIDGIVTVNKDTLYKLVKLPEAGRHILRLEFLDDDTEVFAFTFG